MQKEKALIVDDDPIIRDILADILTGVCGLVTESASNGLEALECLKKERYDIIFTDLNMPKLGGMDLLKETVKTYPATPVVMITGLSTVDVAVTAMKEGASDFIIKPFEIDKVISVTQRIIGEKKLLQVVKENKNEDTVKRINAELFKKLQEISIFQELSLQLDGIYNNKEIYEKILEMSIRLVPVKGAFFGVVEGDHLRIVNSIGFTKGKIKIENSFIESTIKNRVHNIINCDGISHFSTPNSNVQLLLLPFTLREESFALLGLWDKEDKTAFAEDEIAILRTFAKKAALRIENNALYEVFYNNLINTLKSLVISIEARDSYTKQHSERVAIYSIQIAEVMGLADEEKDAIRFGAYLHDIGKIGVRDTVLLKPTALTEEEMAEIRLHPIKGDEIVKPIRFFPKERELIRYHHERFDGKGYPDGLKGNEIPLIVRILSLADAYDAMTSARPYRAPRTHDYAKKEIINNIGAQFDPEVVKAFLQTPTGKGKNYE